MVDIHYHINGPPRVTSETGIDLLVEMAATLD